ncbi:MAG: UvrD-helicase domain-containing protein, partial [Victivallales bacterium]|nr:UvrD-helicase domain-containing protein [Victivallales bacterium]
IQILFMRMLLQGVPITEILVVTFTELATAELRDRLRRILSETINACSQFKTNDSLPYNRQILPFFDAALCNDAITHANIDDVLKHLKTAQQAFDDAPVSTIHGFCSRMLNENAFESGLRYGMKPRTDVSDLVFKALNDFCRQECYLSKGETTDQSNAIRAMQEAAGCRPDVLQKSLEPLLSGGNAIPNWGDYDWGDLNTPADAITNRRRELEAEFPLLFDQLIAIKDLAECVSSSILNKDGRDFFENDNLLILSELFRICHPKAISETIKAFEQMTSKKDKWFKKKTVDQTLSALMAQPVMKTVEKLKSVFDEYGQILKKLAYDFVLERIRSYKSQDAFITFDDMLTELDTRLRNPLTGSALADTIRKKFRGAIVDEFQDTDQTQYSIFNMLFMQSADHFFFMIGDPKQAIYKFRGGDIFTYLKAKDAIPDDNRHTLSVNFRSSNNYIAAMNDFFKDVDGNDFFNNPNAENLDYGNVSIQTPKDNKKTFERPSQTPLPLISYASDNPKTKSLAPSTIANEIHWLVNQSGYVITNNDNNAVPISYGDIAVLVRSHLVGEAVEKALRKIGIPCVWNGGTNIFSTQEAASLISLFDALANPGSQPFAIVLLADALFGLTAEQLETIRQNGLPEFQLFLSSLATLWQQTSFLTMFNTLMQTSLQEIFPTWLQENTSLDVTQRLVVHIAARPDGRRSVAIYRQLGDILHQISLERSLGLSGLKEFLSRNITKAKPKKSYNSNQSNDELNSSDAADRQEDDPDKYALRVATQDAAVKIMTIHKSKGLEFPIVFVPVLDSANRASSKIYHTDDKSRHVLLKNNTLSIEQKLCDMEENDENKRLLYVAITRAKYLCRFMLKPRDSRDLMSFCPSFTPDDYVPSDLSQPV